MELKLKKAGHDYYEGVAWPSFSCETMRESIVPDSCADIARIVDTTGLVCLTGRELTSDGRLSASGTVDVSVLYIPEKGDGPCALRFQIPFQCSGEGQDAAEAEFLDIRGELQNIDTRVLNPRKVLTRANLTFFPAAATYPCLFVQMLGRQTHPFSCSVRKKKLGSWREYVKRNLPLQKNCRYHLVAEPPRKFFLPDMRSGGRTVSSLATNWW